MKKHQILTLLFVLLFSFTHAQIITFISEKTGQPLPKVSVFGNDGSILAFSDINGKIDKQLIKPDQEKFQLVYDNFSVATLSYSDFDKEVIKINDRIKEIEAVVIKNDKPAKYVFIKGNFNAYITINNKLNCYVDGIATYVFDNKTKKIKSTNVQQYRVFRLEGALMEKKETIAWDYAALLNLPALGNVGNIDEFKSKKATIKELKGKEKDEIEISGSALQGKEMALFGYRLFDSRNIINHSYDKDSRKTLRDFLESNEISFLKFKHKSEPDYNQIIIYRNFYPTELDFTDDKEVADKVKFSIFNSQYKTEYWKDASFPNMQSVFSSFFKGDLKEKQNIK